MKALIFDFDGTIVDTETPDFQSWQEIYKDHGCELLLSDWAACIGTASPSFNPYAHLETLLGRSVDRDAIRYRRRRRYKEMADSYPMLPGVMDYLDDASTMGLELCIASSSPRSWVEGHLARIGIRHRFPVIKCADDVARTKPDPELYLSILEELGIQSREALAIEDSPNGHLAAKNAGLFCLVVPNPLTSGLTFDCADLIIGSLDELPLADLLRLASANARTGTGI